MYFWQRLFAIVSQLPGVQTKLKRVQMHDISDLWRVLKTHFCPKSDIELVQRGKLFQEMTQGNQSIRDFTNASLVYGYKKYYYHGLV